MTWLLTIIILLDGQSITQPVGLMIDAAACRLAGDGIARAMSLASPGVPVFWPCAPQPEAMS